MAEIMNTDKHMATIPIADYNELLEKVKSIDGLQGYREVNSENDSNGTIEDFIVFMKYKFPDYKLKPSDFKLFIKYSK